MPRTTNKQNLQQPDTSTKTIIERLQTMTTAMTIPQVATLLSMDKATLYRHARAGKVPTIEFCGNIRIDPQELARTLLASRAK